MHVGNVSARKKKGDALDPLEAFLSGRYSLTQCDDLRQQRFGKVIKALDMLSGYNLCVPSPYGTDIQKRHQIGIFEDHVRLDLAPRHLAEKA